jgi:hypothetical protein
LLVLGTGDTRRACSVRRRSSGQERIAASSARSGSRRLSRYEALSITSPTLTDSPPTGITQNQPLRSATLRCCRVDAGIQQDW